MNNVDYDELDGAEAARKWVKKMDGDQVFSPAEQRWRDLILMNTLFQTDRRYRRPKPRPTEAMHFL